MKAYHIVDRRIMLRDHQGDLFEFALTEASDKATLELVGRPCWKDGVTPRDAAIRIDVAALQARDIARQTGMLR